MPWPKRIILVRHAESEGNARLVDMSVSVPKPNHRYEITPRGVEQARMTGTWLKERYGAMDAHYASTYLRTQQTLALVCPDAPHAIDPRINEHHRGIWHSQSVLLRKTKYAEEEEALAREGWYHYRAPGGLSGPDVELNIHSFFSDLREFHASEQVLIVCHGSWLILGWRMVTNATVEQAEERYRRGQFFNASVTVYEPQPDGKRLQLVLDNFAPWAPEGGEADAQGVIKNDGNR